MIGITICENNFDLYLIWLEHFNAKFAVIDFRENDALDKFSSVSGLILSGGIDIYPELYNDWENKEDTGKYNSNRDGFEYKLIEYALKYEIPILGICRGCQLLNVYFNGSLIYDIPTIRKVNHNKIDKDTMRLHNINIVKDTILYNCVNKETGIVNSSHHQSVDRLGEGLMISSRADDGIIESIEYADKSNKSFLMGIQWHPERLTNYNDEFSKNIYHAFKDSLK